ncbi:JAB domain-containing protein [Lutibacter sp. A64]|uniref:JAB domain-containing protein n=1 Tax=Lutibacter sp. A64 TaxID=2918526 RepID=UPI0035304BEA
MFSHCIGGGTKQEGFIFIMRVSEIKVSYSSNNSEQVKIVSSETAYEVVLEHWDKDIIEFQEEIKVLLLNRANMVLGIYNLSKGGVSGSILDVKIVLSVALKCNASSIIIVHNHPSGNLTASTSDMSITSKLKEACKTLDLSLLDHLIISKDSFYSMNDNGLI